MLGLLALLFLVVPIAELYVIVQVAHGIGVPETILLLIASQRRRRLAGQVGRAQRAQPVPAHRATGQGARRPKLVDGALVLLAGALMIAPGFLSDCLAILLLLPPSRSLVRHAVLRRIRAGGGLISVMTGRCGRARAPTTAAPATSGTSRGWEEPPAPPDRPEASAHDRAGARTRRSSNRSPSCTAWPAR